METFLRPPNGTVTKLGRNRGESKWKQKRVRCNEDGNQQGSVANENDHSGKDLIETVTMFGTDTDTWNDGLISRDPGGAARSKTAQEVKEAPWTESVCTFVFPAGSHAVRRTERWRRS